MTHFATSTYLLGLGVSLVTGRAAPRPDVVGRSDERVARNVPQQPEGGPKTAHVTFARQYHLGFDYATREAELVPGLDHRRAELRKKRLVTGRGLTEPGKERKPMKPHLLRDFLLGERDVVKAGNNRRNRSCLDH